MRSRHVGVQQSCSVLQASGVCSVMFHKWSLTGGTDETLKKTDPFLENNAPAKLLERCRLKVYRSEIIM